MDIKISPRVARLKTRRALICTSVLHGIVVAVGWAPSRVIDDIMEAAVKCGTLHVRFEGFPVIAEKRCPRLTQKYECTVQNSQVAVEFDALARAHGLTFPQALNFVLNWWWYHIE